MSDESPDDHEEHKAGAWAVSNFLTPPVCAIAALTLAIAALLDQDAVPVGFAAVLEEEVARPAGFYVVRGLVTVLQVAVVLLLARRSFAAGSSPGRDPGSGSGLDLRHRAGACGARDPWRRDLNGDHRTAQFG
jgi:hypothetical protein